MTGRCPFKKTDDGASSSSAAKKKAPSPKKEQNQLYFWLEITQALYDQNESVGLCDVQLLDGW
jgi:hypothetical protein